MKLILDTIQAVLIFTGTFIILAAYLYTCTFFVLGGQAQFDFAICVATQHHAFL